MIQTLLSVDQLSHAFQNDRAQAVPVLENVSFQLKKGRIACLLGPSGCGKTTLLRCIAGFQRPQAGRIQVHDQLVLDQQGVCLPPEQRRVGFVFQDYALFPHLTVEQNVAFGLRTLGVEHSESSQRVAELLSTMGLAKEARSYPHALSGGQKQRVALARALAPRPAVLLLDEPFSNIDPQLSAFLKAEVKRWLRYFEVTALMVTHDQYEAFDIADDIGVLSEGQMHQWGSAYDLYHRPKTLMVAKFIGQGDVLPAQLEAHPLASSSTCALRTEVGLIPLAGKDAEQAKALGQAELSVFLRPDEVEHDDQSLCQGIVEDQEFRGLYHLYRLRLPSGRRLTCFTSAEHMHPPGTRFGVRLNVQRALVFQKGKTEATILKVMS